MSQNNAQQPNMIVQGVPIGEAQQGIPASTPASNVPSAPQVSNQCAPRELQPLDPEPARSVYPAMGEPGSFQGLPVPGSAAPTSMPMPPPPQQQQPQVVVQQQAPQPQPQVVVQPPPQIILQPPPVMPITDFTRGCKLLKAVDLTQKNKMLKQWALYADEQLIGYIRCRLDRKPVKDKGLKTAGAAAGGYLLFGVLGAIGGAAIASSQKGARAPDYGVQFFPADNMIQPTLDCQPNGDGTGEWIFMAHGQTFGREAHRVEKKDPKSKVVIERRWLEIQSASQSASVVVASAGRKEEGKTFVRRNWEATTTAGQMTIAQLELGGPHKSPYCKIAFYPGSEQLSVEARNAFLGHLMTRLACKICG